jgi:hypothetical protein
MASETCVRILSDTLSRSYLIGPCFELPGGLRMTFTGLRVKFADGSRFQNIGIVPDVKAEPTIRGIRAGRDEVLEEGVETLKRLVSEGTTR